MTQEDKELLLQDLCARLPYKVMVNYNGLARPLFNISPTQHFQITLDNALDGEHNGLVYVSLDVDGEEPKPYLRPMSSMTEEESKEYRKTQITKWVKSVDCTYGGYYEHRDTLKTFDWLLAHHFDYRGLIEALEQVKWKSCQ